MSRSRGFMLVESLVGMFVFAVVLALSTSLFAFGTRVFSRETSGATLQQDLIGAKNLLLDDLSIAGYRPDDLVASAAGAFTVLDSADVFDEVALGSSLDSLDFRGDVDSDGSTNRICYRVLGGSLRRALKSDDSTLCSTVWSDPSDDEEEVLLTGVQTFDLAFLDSSRAMVAEADVEDGGPRSRYVQVTLTVQGNVKGGSVSRTARGETAIRN